MDASHKNRFQRRKEQTRQKLSDAAISLILEHGYDAVTIDQIVEKADVGKGTFYLHFKDKEDLVWTVIREGLSQLTEEGERRVRSMPNLEHIEFVGFLVMFEHAQKNQDLYRIMFGSQGHSVFTQRVKQLLAEETEREIRANRSLTDRNLPPEFMAQYVAGALIQALAWWLETPNLYTPTQMAQMFYQMLFLHQIPEG